MQSIWQKQSGGLFRSKCLISLCSITHFCRWSSTFSPALQYLLQYLVMRGIEKAGQFSNCPTVFDCFFVKRS